MKSKILLALAFTSLAFADVHPDHDPEHNGGHHDHGQMIELEDSFILPGLRMTLERDAMNSTAMNLTLKTRHFRFAPEHVNQPHQTVDQEIGPIVEGHAHLFINGVKVTRLYGPNFFLQNVKAGDVIRVELNSNDHRNFSVNGYKLGFIEETIPETVGAQ